MQDPGSVADRPRLIVAAHRIIEHFKTLIVIALVIEVALNCFNVITAFDFPWQLTEGNFIMAHGYAEKSVLQAFGEISPHFANEYVLYEFVIAAINRVGGGIGLALFFGLLEFLLYLPCLLAFIQARRSFSLVYLWIFLFAQFIVFLRMAARPELIADICYLAEGMMLIRLSDRPWSGLQTLGFGLIFCVWANVHASFLIGFAILGLWYGEKFVFNWRSLLFQRDFTWLRPGLAALIGSLLNPFGAFRFVQPFRLHSLLWGQATSAEMWPLVPSVAWLTLTCTALGLLALLVRVRKERGYWMIISLVTLQYLTFCSNRYEIFISLTLFNIIWDGVGKMQKPLVLPALSGPFVLGRLLCHLFISIGFLFSIFYIISAKLSFAEDENRFFFPKTLVSTNSSFFWLAHHSDQPYFTFSHLNVGSWAQLPGSYGIHPMMDSGTHRYSDRTIQLYYYCHFSPELFRRTLTQLDINSIVLGTSNIYWAPVLNADPDWRLVQVASDSQLYLRRNNQPSDDEKQLFLTWEGDTKLGPHGSEPISCDGIVRGLNLRPDSASLLMLEEIRDCSWMYDPLIVYIEDWLKQVPDQLVESSLKNISARTDNSANGLRILLSLRLGQDRPAAEIAEAWYPSVWDKGAYDMQELRAEAFLSVGDTATARTILTRLWPQPRYSLRWAQLCQRAYAGDTQHLPENARLLTSLTEDSVWSDDTIKSLNQNIQRMLSQTP